jgi:transposase
MKKISTVAVKQTKNFSDQKLTIGLDLGDRSSWYCVLEEAGEVLLEQKLGTTPKARKEVFGGMPRSRIALETGMHSPVGQSGVERVGTRSDRGPCAQRALDRGESTER